MEDNLKRISYSGSIKCIHCSLENDNKQLMCKHCGKDLHLYNKKGEIINVSPEFAQNVEKVFELFPEYSKKLVFLANDEKNIAELKDYFINGQREKIFTTICEYYKLFGDLSDISYSDVVDKNYEDFEELIVFYSSILSRFVLENRTKDSSLMNKKMYESISFILGFSSWLIKLRDNVKNTSYDNYNISLDGNELSYLYFRVNTSVEKVNVGKRLDIDQEDEKIDVIKASNEVAKTIKEDSKKLEKPRRPSVITIVVFMIVMLIVSSYGIYMSFFKLDLENVKDSVVMVEIYDKYGNEIATGSGFCAYQNNMVVTNYHVIEGAYAIKLVTDWDQKFNVTKVDIFNAKEDLAILTFDGELVPLKIGNSNTCRIGQKVYAIGSPEGEKNTVSEGTISNLDRKEEIRITTPISHGSSGGALLDDKGRVVGVTFAGYENAQNLNFAIPVNILNELVDSMVKNDYTLITASTYTDAVKEYSTVEDDMFEKDVIDENTNYSSETIENLYYSTSEFSKFDDTITNSREDVAYNYKKYDSASKWKMFTYFKELKDYDNSKDLDSAVNEIYSWKVYDWILNLKLTKRWKLAIMIEELKNLNGRTDAEVLEEYTEGYTEFLIILVSNGSLDLSALPKTNKEDIIDYIYELNSSRQTQGKILEYLGYEVEYKNDGSIVTYY